MSLSLYVDGDRWRAHLRSVGERHPGVVPVAKGNGYGLGLGRLARKAQWLGSDTLAIGTYDELPEVARRFDGDLMVLTPWRPFSDVDLADPRVIHTVGRLDDLEALATSGHRPRVVLERMTSMRRHGFSARGLRDAAARARAGGVRVEGFALHLPLAVGGSHRDEVMRLMNDLVATALGHARTVYVSHLSDAELTDLGAQFPDHVFRARVGTDLWLGDRGALDVRARVLDVHPIARGQRYGYRGRTMPRAGHLLVVAGGTAHGIGLEAPTGDLGLRGRAASFARGGLDAAGLVRSPYVVGGKHRVFAEPPHMQASMLVLPPGVTPPAVGDEVGVRVRFTATAFDRVVVS